MLRNFTENLMTYALGRRIEYYDKPTVRAIIRDAAQNDNRFSSFVAGHRQQPGVQMSKANRRSRHRSTIATMRRPQPAPPRALTR